MTRTLVTLVALVALCDRAQAEPVSDPDPQREVRGGVGVGGYGAITGSERLGSMVDLVIYPGGALGRFGIRLEGRGLGQIESTTFLGGVTYEAGVARPTLQIGLYATIGATRDRDPALALGVQTQLVVLGPLGIGADASGLLIIDGTQDTELLLMGALTMRLIL